MSPDVSVGCLVQKCGDQTVLTLPVGTLRSYLLPCGEIRRDRIRNYIYCSPSWHLSVTFFCGGLRCDRPWEAWGETGPGRPEVRQALASLRWDRPCEDWGRSQQPWSLQRCTSPTIRVCHYVIPRAEGLPRPRGHLLIASLPVGLRTPCWSFESLENPFCLPFISLIPLMFQNMGINNIKRY